MPEQPTLNVEMDLTPCLICGAVVFDPETHLRFHGGDPSLDVVAQMQAWVQQLQPDEIEAAVNDQLGALAGGADTVGAAVKAWLAGALIDLFGAPEPGGEGG